MWHFVSPGSLALAWLYSTNFFLPTFIPNLKTGSGSNHLYLYDIMDILALEKVKLQSSGYPYTYKVRKVIL